MELKPLNLGEVSDLIPSGAIPVSDFREHVEKFDENRQLLFQKEFDVSYDIIIMLFISYDIIIIGYDIIIMS